MLSRIVKSRFKTPKPASILKPTLRNLQTPILDTIHQPVFVSNAAGPPSLEFVFQGFGFARSLKRCAGGFFNQGIQFFQSFFVL